MVAVPRAGGRRPETSKEENRVGGTRGFAEGAMGTWLPHMMRREGEMMLWPTAMQLRSERRFARAHSRFPSISLTLSNA
jgi:hypothetical protein